MPVTITAVFKEMSSLFDALPIRRRVISAMRRRELRHMPTDYDTARAFLYGARHAALATLDERHPRASMVNIVPSAEGGLLFMISRGSRPGRSLARNGRGSLVITESCAFTSPDAGRLTLEVQTEPASREKAVRYLALWPEAPGYLAMDFQFVHAHIRSARWLSSTGHARWLDGDGVAGPLPWSEDAEREVLGELNRASESLHRHLSIVGTRPELTEAVMLDPAGIWLRTGGLLHRLTFSAPIHKPSQALIRLRQRSGPPATCA